MMPAGICIRGSPIHLRDAQDIEGLDESVLVFVNLHPINPSGSIASHLFLVGRG
jgi:hypothetical protein